MALFAFEDTAITGETKVTVAVQQETDVLLASQKGRALAARLGFGLGDQVAIAIAISEVARNIVVHAGQGEISIAVANRNGGERPGMIIVAHDWGPGIADVELALQDGYSTRGGLGVGLSGARRLTDEFEIRSGPGSGTTVTMCKWLS